MVFTYAYRKCCSCFCQTGGFSSYSISFNENGKQQRSVYVCMYKYIRTKSIRSSSRIGMCACFFGVRMRSFIDLELYSYIRSIFIVQSGVWMWIVRCSLFVCFFIFFPFSTCFYFFSALTSCSICICSMRAHIIIIDVHVAFVQHTITSFCLAK